MKTGVYVETKGRFLSADRAKHLAIKAQRPDIEVRFVFMQNNPLNKGSDTRYTDWCDKYDFKWAMKTIPKEWAEE